MMPPSTKTVPAPTFAVSETVEVFFKRKKTWVVAQVIRLQANGDVRVRYNDDQVETTIHWQHLDSDSGFIRKVSIEKNPAAQTREEAKVSPKAPVAELPTEAEPVDESRTTEEAKLAEPSASEVVHEDIKPAATVAAIDEAKPAPKETFEEYMLAVETAASEEATAAMKAPPAKATEEHKQASDAQSNVEVPQEVAVTESPSIQGGTATSEVLAAEVPKMQKIAIKAPSISETHAAAEALTAEVPEDDTIVDEAHCKETAKLAKGPVAREATQDEKSAANTSAPECAEVALGRHAPAAATPNEEKPDDGGQPKSKSKPTETPAPGHILKDEKSVAEALATKEASADDEAPVAKAPVEEPCNETLPIEDAKPAETVKEHKLTAETRANEDLKVTVEAPASKVSKESKSADEAQRKELPQMCSPIARTGVNPMCRARIIGGRRMRNARKRLHIVAKDPDAFREEAAKSSLQVRCSMQIFVMPISGKSVTINIDPRDTIFYLKNMLLNKLRIPTSEQRLTYCRKHLQDFHTVSHYAIRKDSTLHMVGRLRAGMQAERRVDPMLDNRSVTYPEMCQGLADQELSEEQLLAHWRNLRPTQALVCSQCSTPGQEGAFYCEMCGTRLERVQQHPMVVADDVQQQPLSSTAIRMTLATQHQTIGVAMQADGHAEVVLRHSPNQGHIVAKVPNGEELVVLETEGEVVKVRWNDVEGWAKATNMRQLVPSTGASLAAPVQQQPVAVAMQADGHAEVVLRHSPNQGHIVAKVPNGEELVVLETEGEVVKVRWKDVEGWAKATNVRQVSVVVPAQQQPIGVAMQADGHAEVVLRHSPNQGHIVAKVPNGEELVVLETEGEVVKVRWKDVEGWVKATNVRQVAAPTAASVVVPAQQQPIGVAMQPLPPASPAVSAEILVIGTGIMGSRVAAWLLMLGERVRIWTTTNRSLTTEVEACESAKSEVQVAMDNESGRDFSISAATAASMVSDRDPEILAALPFDCIGHHLKVKPEVWSRLTIQANDGRPGREDRRSACNIWLAIDCTRDPGQSPQEQSQAAARSASLFAKIHQESPDAVLAIKHEGIDFSTVEAACNPRLPVIRLRFLKPVFFVPFVELQGAHENSMSRVTEWLQKYSLMPFTSIARIRMMAGSTVGENTLRFMRMYASQLYKGVSHESEVCCVCLVEQASVLNGTCGHRVFCAECASDYSQTGHRRCPICRAAWRDDIAVRLLPC